MAPKVAIAQRAYPASLFDTPELLTVQEMARALKMNPQTLYRLVRQGLVPAVRIGKKTLRFDPARIRATLEAKAPRRASAGKREPTAPAITFTRLDDLLASDEWLAPPPDLTLERFAVRLPPGADITALAYDRTAR